MIARKELAGVRTNWIARKGLARVRRNRIARKGHAEARKCGNWSPREGKKRRKLESFLEKDLQRPNTEENIGVLEESSQGEKKRKRFESQKGLARAKKRKMFESRQGQKRRDWSLRKGLAGVNKRE